MTAVTREDGSYEMIVAETGRMTIRAEGPVGGKSYPPRTIEVADADAQTFDLDFPAGTISGIVVDEETDAPIARASVDAVSARPRGSAGGPAGGRGMTGPDGRFTIDVDEGAFRVLASAEGYAQGVAAVTVAEAPVGEVRIALERGGRLRGKVMDSRGRPAPGVELRAVEEAGDEVMDAWAESALDGTFEFAALRPGRYSLAGGSALSGFGMLSGLERRGHRRRPALEPGGPHPRQRHRSGRVARGRCQYLRAAGERRALRLHGRRGTHGPRRGRGVGFTGRHARDRRGQGAVDRHRPSDGARGRARHDRRHRDREDSPTSSVRSSATLLGHATHVGRGHHVVPREQRIGRVGRLLPVDVEAGAGDGPRVQRVDERRAIHEVAAPR